MITQIPQNKILKQTGVSNVLGDVVETFNLDLSSNYGAIRTTGMKKVAIGSGASDLDVCVGFEKYNGNYYAVTDDFVYVASAEISGSYSKDTSFQAPSGETSVPFSDIKVFNDSLYVSGTDEVMKLNGTSWTTPVTTGLVTSPHLMDVYAGRLYITNNYNTVLSISDADAISTTGSFTLDTGLSDDWSISMLKSAKDRIWVGATNTNNGKGIVFQWDGKTEDTWTDSYEIDSGVMAGVILNNNPYILDSHGRLLTFTGSSFTEIGRVGLENNKIGLYGKGNRSNSRFIHPNGMATTDYGSILFFFQNTSAVDGEFENYIPSGIYEYDKNIGTYHKHSISYSPIGSTTVTDYGQQRMYGGGRASGALFYNKATAPSSSINGTLICGTSYSTDNGTTLAYGLFTNDTFDTTQKYSYFVTTKMQSSQIVDTWKKIYATYNKLLTSADKVVIKYRVEEDLPTEASITWTDTETFTTTTDISEYVVGDEIQVVQGTGSGKLAHISSISENAGTYTVELDDTFTGVTGTAKILLSKWIKAGEVDFTDNNRWKAFTISQDNVSPHIQFKVGLQFTGKNELHKLRVISTPTINE